MQAGGPTIWHYKMSLCAFFFLFFVILLIPFIRKNKDEILNGDEMRLGNNQLSNNRRCFKHRFSHCALRGGRLLWSKGIMTVLLQRHTGKVLIISTMDAF